MVEQHLGKPLTQIPDPFGTHESFRGAQTTRDLRAFLDDFGFDYSFKSSSEAYRSGEFDDALMDVLRHYDEIMRIILPTLGAERQATYSPFLPLCPKTGRVLQVPITARDEEAGTVSYVDEDGETMTVPGHGRPVQAAVEGRLGHALACARRRITRWRGRT